MRGKPGGAGNIGFQNRIIPARAGQTCPRVRTRTRRPGSSPRVRGKHVPIAGYQVGVRIIPARAGQTNPWRWPKGAPADHPRACGANQMMSANHHATSGSSPRVRGKHQIAHHVTARHRIIPARAGQTRMPKPTRRTIPDHPRACGANSSLAVLSCKAVGSSPRVRGKPGGTCSPCQFPGSSPRVRGKHDCQTSRRSGYRIIPARAGQTRRGVRVSSTSPDHPRACGANSCSLSRLSSTSGSSPRVRGKLRSRYRHAICYRIIPARAGQTLAGSEGGTTASDHPRACGANAIVIRRSDTPPGSSPRVRGKRYRP